MTKTTTSFSDVARKLLREGAVFYSPTGRTMRNFKDVVNTWALYRRLCFRRRHSDRLWEIAQGGQITELF